MAKGDMASSFGTGGTMGGGMGKQPQQNKMDQYTFMNNLLNAPPPIAPSPNVMGQQLGDQSNTDGNNYQYKGGINPGGIYGSGQVAQGNLNMPNEQQVPNAYQANVAPTNPHGLIRRLMMSRGTYGQ